MKATRNNFSIAIVQADGTFDSEEEVSGWIVGRVGIHKNKQFGHYIVTHLATGAAFPPRYSQWSSAYGFAVRLNKHGIPAGGKFGVMPTDPLYSQLEAANNAALPKPRR